MSGARHTPGPWLNTGRYNTMTDQIGTQNRTVALVWTRQPAQVRDETTQSVRWDEGEANAALILAAPDLLHQLQRVHDALGGETFDWEPVRAALAKAGGAS